MKDNELLVSIRCITYNHEPYIRQCLEGFVMQKANFRFEAIVHDDASTDGTADIIREYAEKYPDIIKPIYETENQYSKHDGSIRRIMDEHMHGKYIAICEGDDYWTDPLKLQKQVDFLEAHPDYSLCFHNATVHYEKGDKTDQVFADYETGEFTRKQLCENWLAPTASFVYRKNILESELYNIVSISKKLMYGDLPLIICASYYGKIWGFNETMSIYRKQPGGAMNYLATVPYKLCVHHIEMKRIFGKDMVPIMNERIGRCASIAISLIRKGDVGVGLKLWSLAIMNAPLKSMQWSVKYVINGLKEKLNKN